MEFHGKLVPWKILHGNPCPNTPWNYMENIPSNSMEFHGGILHGVLLQILHYSHDLYVKLSSNTVRRN